MAWAPQFELIDYLEAEDVRLGVVERLFPDRDRARRTLQHYLQKQVICLVRCPGDSDTPLSTRECYEALWSDGSWEPDAACYVRLTDLGCECWSSGQWDDIWNDKLG